MMGHENVYLPPVFVVLALLVLSIVGLKLLGFLWRASSSPRSWLWARALPVRTWLWANTTMLRHGLMQLFIAIDQLLNVMSNPFSDQTWADETLSSRCGRLGHRFPYKFWKVLIDKIFGLWQGPNHCVNAYIKEKARYNFPPEMREETKEQGAV